MTRRRHRGTDWGDFTGDTFADSVRISLALLILQAVVTVLSKPFGILVAIGVWVYTIAAFLNEADDVRTASGATSLLKAVVVLVVDIAVLLIFWNV